MKINIKKLIPRAIIPSYATDGSGCFDISYSGVEKHFIFSTPIILETGLAFEIPDNHVMLVFSRSGHGFKDGIRLSNCVGIIDSDYRGELLVKLHPDTAPYRDAPKSFNYGDRIAQAMIIDRPKIEFNEVSELSSTLRGIGGFGSTGKSSLLSK